MLWYKSWLETRSRFLIGLVLIIFSAVGVVMFYPRLLNLLPEVNRVDVGGVLGRRIKEGAELVHTYRGYVWSQWLRQPMSNMLTLFAVLLGAVGLLSQASRGGAVFTLSLAVSRHRVDGLPPAPGLSE